MCNALLRLDADIVAEWFVAGKTKDDVKDLMKLPYDIRDVSMSNDGKHVVVTVSVPELPENTESAELEATLGKTQEETGQWTDPNSYEMQSLKAKIVLDLFESEVQ